MNGSLWQKHEHIHRRLIFMDKKRHLFQESIARAENQMLSIFENHHYQPDKEAVRKADDMVRNWTEQWYNEYRNHSFHYPSMSLYGRFWKKKNEQDGFNF